MARHAVILGTVSDFDGEIWDVREARATRHGFEVYMGWPTGIRGPGCGGPRLIPTQDLLNYWEQVKLLRNGAIFDLPVAHTTIGRVRRLLGLDYYCDNAEWWLERLDDLSAMPGRRFAAVHGVSEEMVSIMRTRLVGKRNREPGWYREESNAELLCGNLPRSYVAARLDISIGAVGRLRWLLRRERERK